ncbi:MAG: hypothetical protein RIR10_209 [Planctomycetota bacterium]
MLGSSIEAMAPRTARIAVNHSFKHSLKHWLNQSFRGVDRARSHAPSPSRIHGTARSRVHSTALTVATSSLMTSFTSSLMTTWMTTLMTTSLVAVSISTSASASGSDTESPFASLVVSYVAGSGAASGFTNPSVALGSPERFSGEGFLPQCVTPFQPAFRPNELVSLGLGGSLILAFDHDVLDDPRNPFGIDLLVFGNAFFTDLGGGTGIVGGIASEGGRIFVSANARTWIEVPGVVADGLFPTNGYLDVAPYATAPGKIASNFLRPVDPTWTVGDLAGMDHLSLLDVYDGSGGGAGIDIGALGLASIRYVRIDGPTSIGFSPEIDAVADVAPLEPTADLDNSGAVDASDLSLLLASWGTIAPAFDLDGDGAIGAGDLALLLGAWNGGGS